MSDIETAYVNLRDRMAGDVHRTMEVRPDLMVDLDASGRLLGIERIGGQVDFAAALDIMRALRVGNDVTGRAWIFPMDAKVDALMPDGTHRYWSTHCRHDNHEACSAELLFGQFTSRSAVKAGPPGQVADVTIQQNVAMERKPAQCKTCAAPCICPCHSTPDAGENRPS